MLANARSRGLRALVTRPREEAETLAAALAARGVDALIEPLLTVEFGTAATPDLAGVQAILCTSANGVRALARASSERRLPLFVVGDATAARARSQGFTSVESAGGSATDLARLADEASVANSCATIAALSISAAADAALGELPWRERWIAERPEQPALLDKLGSLLADRRSGGAKVDV